MSLDVASALSRRRARASLVLRSSAMSIELGGVDVLPAGAFDVDGVARVVPTRYGPITVTTQGDPSKPALVTFHDVGLNHRTCFQPLFVCAGRQSDLVKRFCVYHIDYPGCQDGAVEFREDDVPRTLDALAEQVEDVVKHFGLRSVTCMGVGAGATVMALYAGRAGSRCEAGIFVSPSVSSARTMESALGYAFQWNIRRHGWTPWTLKHVMKRMFSYRGLGGMREAFESDLAKTARREISELNPRAVLAFYESSLARLNNDAIYESLDIDALILAGRHSPWYKDSIVMNSLMNTAKTAWVEMEDAGTVVTVEDPSAMLSPLNLFIQRLASEGLA